MKKIGQKYKYGFTLAEALLTMIILGIILAFILPSLISTKPSEDKLLYKKAFFTLSEAMMAVVNNPELYDINQYYVLKYPIEGNEENFCKYLANYLNTIGNVNCDGNEGSFKLANGVIIEHVPKKAVQIISEETPEGETSSEETPGGETSLDETVNEENNENTEEQYFTVITSGNEANKEEDCNKRNSFIIRYSSNGKVYTSDEDTCENEILESGTKIQMKNSNKDE